MKNKDFDKYYYYNQSVQSADHDVQFFQNTYKEITGKKPVTFREDFCGTFALCCEWVKLSKDKKAFGIDLDPEPIAYGEKNYLSKLTRDQQNRVNILCANVLAKNLPASDVHVAVNFSYFIFKDRKTIKAYFSSCFKSLNKNGVLFLDCFGGSKCQEANEDETEHEDKNFSYFWEQENFDPVTNHATFHIHFKREGERKRKKVFTYDWRMWSIPELKDILEEVGFSASYVYWEGTDEADGSGNGEFTQVKKGEECEAWIAYIAAYKK